MTFLNLSSGTRLERLNRIVRSLNGWMEFPKDHIYSFQPKATAKLLDKCQIEWFLKEKLYEVSSFLLINSIIPEPERLVAQASIHTLLVKLI